MSELQKIIDEAAALLAVDHNDEVIELLRQFPESNKNAKLARLLAKAYFQRGGKGDMYAAEFFATRAIDAGEETSELFAIRAIAFFKTKDFVNAVANFAKYVDNSSSDDTCYLQALALLYCGKNDDSLVILRRIIQSSPKNINYLKSLTLAEDIEKGEKKPFSQTVKKQDYYLGGLEDASKEGDSPYQSCALSKSRGYATDPKDKYYHKESIPCQKQCPVHTDIPGYLTAIYEERYADAYKINLRDNVFPAVLGRVCARPCEEDCRHGRKGLGESVAICYSKRAGADLQEKEDLVLLDSIFEKSDKKVAVVGSGVAGLATARDLALYGHNVTVYEKYHKPGGMLIQGLPAFRLPRVHVEKEIAQVEAQGVSIKCSCEIGKDISLEQLLADNDAVVMAAGTLQPNCLDLPGKELKGIRHGLDFLLEANETDYAESGKHVLIIGGGFTAMDCARVAKRLTADIENADVKVYYRRTVDEMLVTPGELEDLAEEDIPVDFLVSPIEYIGENGHVTSVKFIRNHLGEQDESGRRRPLPIPGSEFELPADLVLLATGQFPDHSWIDESLKTDLVDEKDDLKLEGKYNTFDKKLFACGDYAHGAWSLIQAIGSARKCARKVDKLLFGKSRIQKGYEITDVQSTGRIIEMDDVSLIDMPKVDTGARTLECEVETGFDKALAVEEAQRCYRCNLKYEIDQDRCIFCDWCIKAKSQSNCIVAVKHLNFSEDGEITGYKEASTPDETNQIYIDQSKCIRCNKCLEACPANAISIQKIEKKLKFLEYDGCSCAVNS